MRESLTSFYFPHDTAASHDPKLITLRVQFGYKAVGMYWNIIEALHRESEGKMPRNQLHSMVWDFYSQEEIRTHSHIIDEAKDFEEALFDTGVLREDNDGMIYSTRVLSNLAERKEKSEAARAAVAKRWNKGNGEDKPTKYERNTYTNTDVILERKGKDSKEKEIYLKKPTKKALENDEKLKRQEKPDSEVIKQFWDIAKKAEWTTQDYEDAKTKQFYVLSKEWKEDILKKMRVMINCTFSKSESTQRMAKKIYHETVGLIQDRALDKATIDGKSIAKRREFAEEENGKKYVEQELDPQPF